MSSIGEYYRDLRIQQAATRAVEWDRVGREREEAQAMSREQYEKQFEEFLDEVGSREFTWDSKLPVDLMEPHDWMRLEPRFIRDWILSCKLGPSESCHGVFHEKRKFYTVYKRWDWVTTGWCPVRLKETEIGDRERSKE